MPDLRDGGFDIHDIRSIKGLAPWYGDVIPSLESLVVDYDKGIIYSVASIDEYSNKPTLEAWLIGPDVTNADPREGPLDETTERWPLFVDTLNGLALPTPLLEIWNDDVDHYRIIHRDLVVSKGLEQVGGVDVDYGNITLDLVKYYSKCDVVGLIRDVYEGDTVTLSLHNDDGHVTGMIPLIVRFVRDIPTHDFKEPYPIALRSDLVNPSDPRIIDFTEDLELTYTGYMSDGTSTDITGDVEELGRDGIDTQMALGLRGPFTLTPKTDDVSFHYRVVRPPRLEEDEGVDLNIQDPFLVRWRGDPINLVVHTGLFWKSEAPNHKILLYTQSDWVRDYRPSDITIRTEGRGLGEIFVYDQSGACIGYREHLFNNLEDITLPLDFSLGNDLGGVMIRMLNLDVPPVIYLIETAGSYTSPDYDIHLKTDFALPPFVEGDSPYLVPTNGLGFDYGLPLIASGDRNDPYLTNVPGSLAGQWLVEGLDDLKTAKDFVVEFKLRHSRAVVDEDNQTPWSGPMEDLRVLISRLGGESVDTVYFMADAINYMTDATAGDYTVNRWNHFVLVMHGGDFTVYLNRIRVLTGLQSPALTLDHLFGFVNRQMSGHDLTQSTHLKDFGIYSGDQAPYYALADGSATTIPESLLTNFIPSYAPYDNDYYPNRRNFNAVPEVPTTEIGTYSVAPTHHYRFLAPNSQIMVSMAYGMVLSTLVSAEIEATADVADTSTYGIVPVTNGVVSVDGVDIDTSAATVGVTSDDHAYTLVDNVIYYYDTVEWFRVSDNLKPTDEIIQLTPVPETNGFLALVKEYGFNGTEYSVWVGYADRDMRRMLFLDERVLAESDTPGVVWEQSLIDFSYWNGQLVIGLGTKSHSNDLIEDVLVAGDQAIKIKVYRDVFLNGNSDPYETVLYRTLSSTLDIPKGEGVVDWLDTDMAMDTALVESMFPSDYSPLTVSPQSTDVFMRIG